MKRIITLLLCVVVCLTALPVFAANRDTSFENELAETLRDLGLFKGVSDTNFALDRAPTRIEAIVMLIRLLGEEQKALDSTASHPFTDVPEWADSYVGYAFSTGLANGVSSDRFGTGDANAAMYLTFVLRSLGYSDKDDADFSWDDPFSLAERTGILPIIVTTKNFLRADTVSVSYAALNARLKDSEKTLSEKLVDAGALDAEKYAEKYDANVFEKFISALDSKTNQTPAVGYDQTLSQVEPTDKNESQGLTPGQSSSPSEDSGLDWADKAKAIQYAKECLSMGYGYSRERLFAEMLRSGLVGSGNEMAARADYVVDNCGADWNQQAVKAAKNYINSSSYYSRETLISQLEFSEHFTHEQAVYGVDNCGADWNEPAVIELAKIHLKTANYSREVLISQLERINFTHEEAVYGADNCGADWNEQAVKAAKGYLELYDYSREGLISYLEYCKFTHEQAEYAANQVGL